MSMKYDLKRLALSKYKTLDEVALLLHSSPEYTFRFAKSSKKLHACELPDGDILFHPDSVVAELRHRMQSLVRREIANEGRA